MVTTASADAAVVCEHSAWPFKDPEFCLEQPDAVSNPHLEVGVGIGMSAAHRSRDVLVVADLQRSRHRRQGGLLEGPADLDRRDIARLDVRLAATLPYANSLMLELGV
jgi:hypothetical protein